MTPFEIPLYYRLYKKWRHVFIGTFWGVVFYLLINLLRPDYGILRPIFEGQILTFIKDFFFYYLGFEWISVFIFMKLSLVYVKVFKMEYIRPGWKSVLLFNFKYIPFILVSILLFAPVTNGIRYIVFNYPNLSWETYFPEYFMQSRMYIRYLVPLFFLGMGYLNYTVFVDYNYWQNKRFKKKIQTKEKTKLHIKIPAFDHQGETMLSATDLIFIETKNKNYFLHTKLETLQTKSTITELEELLDTEGFFRINRATLINLKYFKNYAHWEYDKYIIRCLNTDKEFIMQRSRLKSFRETLTEYNLS